MFRVFKVVEVELDYCQVLIVRDRNSGVVVVQVDGVLTTRF